MSPDTNGAPPASHTQLRLPALDGLRGCAALSVVLAHLSVNIGLLPYGPGAVCGVLVFFVLSGYLIARIVWSLPPTVASYRTFIAKRMRRLLPALSALCLAGLPLMVLAGREPFGNALLNVALAATQMTGFAWTAGADVHPAWSPTWSLSVEWTFYLVAPILLIRLRRRNLGGRQAVLVLSFVAAMLYAVALFVPPRAFYLLPLANLAIMFLGASLALSHVAGSDRGLLRVRPGTPVLGSLLLVVIAVLPAYTLATSYRLLTLPAVALATVLVIHQVRNGGPLVGVLSSRVLRGVGVRAYSIYLWHLPVLWVAWANLTDHNPFLVSLVGLAALVPVVEVSYRLLERPFMGTSVRGTEVSVPALPRAMRSHTAPMVPTERTEAC